MLFSCKQVVKEQISGFTKTDLMEVGVENDFQISLPDYFKPAANLNDDAILQYQNIFKETYIIIIEELKSNFIDMFIELGSYDEGISCLENYRNIQLVSFQQSVEMRDIKKTGRIEINNMPAEIVDFVGKVEDIPNDIYYKLGFVESDENIYMIMTWTLLSRKDKYNKDFENAIKSFKVLDELDEKTEP